ncbi:MAG TPA: DUF2889 domain-containing protein [Ramlibacter sp.]|nr:DUF2889 domain-containing protein [Ramlibacter sp.]
MAASAVVRSGGNSAGGFALPDPRSALPQRRAPGVRRTCTIDVRWPAGRNGRLVLEGVGRDIRTHATAAPPTVLAHDTLRVEISPERRILSVSSVPERPQLALLAGISRAGELRQVLRDLRAAQVLQASPLYQLADDIPGVLVVADWAWSRWPQLLGPDEPRRRVIKLAAKEGVCAGFRAGSSALRTRGDYQEDRVAAVQPLSDPRDCVGWHELPEIREVTLRRARCIDVWFDGEARVEAFFQDSATTDTGGRSAVHEYTVRASVSADGDALAAIEAVPHVLPFAECPGALNHLQALVGSPLKDLREDVLQTLARTKGCTHLNDVIRSLADVPGLLAASRQAL